MMGEQRGKKAASGVGFDDDDGRWFLWKRWKKKMSSDKFICHILSIFLEIQ